MPKLKLCPRGHKFYKNSLCPACPVCWPDYRKQIQGDFPEKIGAPALRALSNAGIKKLKELSKYSKTELLALHGFGPKALKLILAEMKKKKIKLPSEE